MSIPLQNLRYLELCVYLYAEFIRHQRLGSAPLTDATHKSYLYQIINPAINLQSLSICKVDDFNLDSADFLLFFPASNTSTWHQCLFQPTSSSPCLSSVRINLQRHRSDISNFTWSLWSLEHGTTYYWERVDCCHASSTSSPSIAVIRGQGQVLIWCQNIPIAGSLMLIITGL